MFTKVSSPTFLSADHSIHSSYLALNATIESFNIKMAMVRTVSGTAEPITSNNNTISVKSTGMIRLTFILY